ncbi:hypothetical protein H4R24_004327 [Coemansia sp. RSA 988]|nr:hypothetical protein H4R24_004327 [Coemansia sp. RSA 988]
MGSKLDLSLTQNAGTLNLAHSLMRSRLTWITNAFDRLDERSMELSRQALGLAEMQIGPHIFSKVKFYSVTGPTDSIRSSSIQSPRRLLAFEFADNSGTFFWLPPDLGIDYMRHERPDYMRVYFFASPRHRTVDRKPSRIRKDWPHYFSADKVLTRINIDISEADRLIIDAVSDYVVEHPVRVWHDYRQTLCQSAPTVKYWYAFFSRQHRSRLLEAAHVVDDVKAPSVHVSRAAAKDLATDEEKSHAKDDQCPSLPIIETHSLGGKAGYNATVAAAYFKSRKGARLKTDEYEDSNDDSDSDVGAENKSSEKSDVLAEDTAKRAPQTTTLKVRPSNKRSAVDSPTARKTRRTASSSVSTKRICNCCGCGETPIWRRGPKGTGTLCNACGVKWKLGKILQ